MIRKEAVEIIGNYVGKNPIVSANGFMSRDLFEMNDKKSNFYMIGSMGLASSIGLGIALKNPRKKIFVFDGDGNILMNMGSLATIFTASFLIMKHPPNYKCTWFLFFYLIYCPITTKFPIFFSHNFSF